MFQRTFKEILVGKYIPGSISDEFFNKSLEDFLKYVIPGEVLEDTHRIFP